MSKVIQVKWLQTKNGDVLVGGGRVLGSIRPDGDAWLADVNMPTKQSRQRIRFKPEAIKFIESQVCVIEISSL